MLLPELVEQLRCDSGFIRIGGKARAGKSTFANKLEQEIARQGAKAFVVRADNYLGGPQYMKARLQGQFPYDGQLRTFEYFQQIYEFPRIHDDLLRFLTGESVGFPTCDRIEKIRRFASPLQCDPETDLVIFEGMVGLLIQEVNEFPGTNIYVKTNEFSRLRDLVKDWEFRGMDKQQRRRKREHTLRGEDPLLETTQPLADFTVHRHDDKYEICSEL